MDDTWQLQKAKAEFSKLIDMSIRLGPQIVTRHGRPAAVVLSVESYRKLRRRAGNFKTFLRQAKLYELDLRRSRDTGRRVDL
ncbi:MAG: type II toxin-antitoxin system Phd/YefM family antitoxin [Proteobacteria bacterium]|nr:type II toxin-antitoxin system Phd/YefM family antitoxin [Pseudomonadota bacterium]